MRPYTAPYTASAAWPPQDPAFEPEEEAVCGALPHNRLPTAEPPANAAIVPPKNQTDFDYQQGPGEADGGADVEDGSGTAGPRMFRMFRDLVAKRAVERHLRRKARGPRKPRGATFEHLMCCVQNSELQENLGKAEQQISRQSLELKNVNRARNEEVAQLSAEVSHLQQQLRQQDDLLEEGGQDASQELRVQLEMATARARIETEDLRQQLIAQRAEIEHVRQQMLQAQREAAEYRAKLAVYRETHEQEMSELRRRLQPPSAGGPQVAPSEAEVEETRRRIAELDQGLRAAQRGREEAEALLRTEQDLHRQEVELLLEELRAAQAETRQSQDQCSAAVAGGAAGSRSREVELEEKVLQVACEKLQADKALRELEESDQALLRQCRELYGPASQLMAMFGQPALPPPRGSEDDPSSHMEWLQALASNMTDLYHQLQVRMKEGQL